MNHLFAYFTQYEHQFASYLASLVHYHKNSGGVLPGIPEPPVTAASIAAATLPNVDRVVPTPVPPYDVTPPVQIDPNINPPPGPSPTLVDPMPPDPIGPDANGFSLLDGITNPSTNPNYRTARHQVKEISDLFPAGSFQRGSAETNLAFANGEWLVAQFIGTGVQVEQVHNDVTGGNDFRIKHPTTNLPNTFTWPDAVVNGHNLGTVAGVVAHINSLV